MKFSIIICGYNESKHLDACLAACVAQDFLKDQFEVIYVDNNSVDGSIDIARKYPIQTLNETRQGPSEARNWGIAAAQGEILLFVDADAILTSNYLKECYGLFDQKEIGAVTGKVIPLKNTWVSNYLGVSLFEGHPRLKNKRFLRACPSNNLAIRKTVIDEVGGFLEKLSSGTDVTRFAEDKELCERIRKGGYLLLYDPRLSIIHDHRETFSKLFSVWIKGSKARAGMIQMGMKDPFSQLFKYNVPLLLVLVFAVTAIFAPQVSLALLLLAFCASIFLSIKSYADTDMFIQSFFIKPWMDILSALVINSSVLIIRVTKR